MKQFITLLTLASLLAVYIPTAMAYDFSSVAPSGQTLYYNIVDGNAEVTYQGYCEGCPHYNNLTGSLTIPSSVTYNGNTYSVTSIGFASFSYCTELTSVTIPNSVTSIGHSAFYDCSGLTSVYYTGDVAGWCGITFDDNPLVYAHNLYINGSLVTDLVIPSDVTEIKKSTFDGATCLTSVTIPNSVTSIGEFAFACCTGLTTITIPNSVTSIGYGTFYGCTGLTTITIPNSVTSIDYDVFYNCTGLTSVIIPNSVTSIGEYAFAGCTGLTSITIPNSVTTIGGKAFVGCSGLSTMVVENGNTVYDSRNNCNAIIETSTNILISGCKNTTIPNTVISIGKYSFSGCAGLTSVTIPNSVTSIGEYAFSGCTGISEIFCKCNVPPTLVYAFDDIPAHTPVYIPCGRTPYYAAADGWSRFTNFIEEGENIFSAVSADNNMGVVQILTRPTCTSPQAVIYASPNSGYRFDHWSDGNTANPRTLTVTEDTELIGYFVPDGGPNVIDDVETADNIKIYTRSNTIVIDFSGQQAVGSRQNVVVYDVMGRVIKHAAGSGQQAVVEIPVTSAGVYMVKVGGQPSHKVVVRP